MVHANAVLTPRGRLMLARLVVDEGWPIVRAAEHFNVSWPTAKRWALRYWEMGAAGMQDRSSRPHHSPNRTSQAMVERSCIFGGVNGSRRWRSPLGCRCQLPQFTLSWSDAV